MSRHSSRERAAQYAVETYVPDVDIVTETWTPTDKQFAEYKRREVELAVLRQNATPWQEWDRGLFSFDSWLRAMVS